MIRIEVDNIIAATKVQEKIIFTQKGRLDQNKCLTFSVPSEESKQMSVNGEYLVTVEGPINAKRTAYNRIVLSL